MKKNLLMLLVVAAGLLSTSCGKDKPDTPVTLPADINLTATNALGGFREKFYKGMDCFVVALADVELSGDATNPKVKGAGNMLFLQLYNTAPEIGVLPQTTYKVVMSTAIRTRTCAGDYSGFTTTDESGTAIESYNIKSGTIEVSREGTKYTLTINVTLFADGKLDKTLKATYSGDLDFKRAPYSPFNGDYTVNLKDLPSGLLFSPTQIGGPTDTWNINIYSMEDGSEGMQILLDFPAGETNTSTGIPAGTYEVGTFTDKAVVVPGTMKITSSEATLIGTWYVGNFLDKVVGKQAPATAGSLTITRNEENPGEYTVNFDFVDDTIDKFHFTGTYTGVPEVKQAETGVAAKPAAAGVLSSTELVKGNGPMSTVL